MNAIASDADASVCEVVHVRCPNGDAPFAVTVWRIIDAERRPDLVRAITEGTLQLATCGECGESSPVDTPLLVWQRDRFPPLIYVPSGTGTTSLRAAEDESFDLYEELRRRAPHDPSLATPAVVAAGPQALARVLLSDVPADVAAHRHGELTLAADDPYRTVLDALLVKAEEDAVGPMIEACLDALTWRELIDAVVDHPDLLSERVSRQMTRERDGALEHGNRVAARHIEEHLDALAVLARGAMPAAHESAPLGEESELILRGRELDELGPEGDPAAIRALAVRSLELVDPHEGPDAWARLSRVAAHADLRLGAVDAAIDRLELVGVVARDGSSEWILATHDLGVAYASRRTGDLADNIERAISSYETVLEHRSLDADPIDWATTQLNLGVAYRRRVTGSAADNLELSISCYRKALTVFEAHDRKLTVAQIRCNLASAYLQRQFDDPEANRRTALELLDGAVEIVVAQGNAGEAAIALLARGNALRVGGDEAELEEAAASFRLAIDSYLRGGKPIEAAMARLNLGVVQFARKRPDRRANLAEGAKQLEQAIDELPESQAPTERASAQYNLALVRRAQFREGFCETTQERCHAEVRTLLSHSLEALSPEQRPAYARDAAQLLGSIESDGGNWSAAAAAFMIALAAATQLYDEAMLSSARGIQLRASGVLHAEAAYALARDGQIAQAVAAVERGRALWLRDVAVPADATGAALDASEQNDLRQALDQLREVTESERGFDTFTDPDTRAELRAALDRRARAARARIAHATSGTTHVDSDIDIDVCASELGPAQALICLISTRWGGAAIVIGRDGAVPVWLDGVTDKLVADLLTRGRETRESYLHGLQQATGALQAPLQRLISELGPPVVDALATHLREREITNVTVIATGYLAMVPVHALLSSDGECLLDLVDVAYAPSVRMWRTVRGRAADADRPRHFVGVANPLPSEQPLAFAVAEVNAIAALFGGGRILPEDEAGKREFLDALDVATHVHLACHGEYDFERPLTSYLQLAGQEILTLHQLLDEGGFSGVRLVVAAACQSALAQYDGTPDEMLGFPGGFLHAGAAGVIGTTWPVQDLAAALLAIRLYAAHVEGRDPVGSLASAVRWLRDATAAELSDVAGGVSGFETAAALLAARGRANPGLRPYEQAVHWAPYVFVGA